MPHPKPKCLAARFLKICLRSSGKITALVNENFGQEAFGKPFLRSVMSTFVIL